ncbi:MAG: universal stress protein [Syntrophobacteraceae bacterium]
MRPLFKKIGFCTDFSEHAHQAFIVAKEIAVQFGASIEIIHVTTSYEISSPVPAPYLPVTYDGNFFEEIRQAALKSIQERYVGKLPEGLSYAVNLESGYPATEILRVAEEKEIDLLVMGSRGLTGIAHVLFGSTADRVVRRATCSVLAVRLGK